MEIENKDLKEEDETSQDNGQPEEKETEDSEDSESLEDEKSEEDEKSKEETVQISKSELEKLQRDKENYKQGLLSAKRKGRTIPGVEPVVKKEENDEFTEQEFVTKKDFQKGIEKSAIREASKNPEVDENWDSIMEYYNARHGKDTIEDILTDIGVAHKTWKAQQPSKPEKKDDEDKKFTSDLAKDAGLGKGRIKESKPERKSILPKREKMSEWYK